MNAYICKSITKLQRTRPSISFKRLIIPSIAQQHYRHQQKRSSSQLYPPTSQPWEEAMAQAELIIGDTSPYSNLRQWVSGEYTTITKYLQRLVGTNHPMLETAKRCTYISEGRMGSAQARALVVLLTSKSAKEMSTEQPATDKEKLFKRQMSLAEMTEMTYSAYMIHRGVMDIKLTALEEVGNTGTGTNATSQMESAKAIHYGNKVSILCGDFLLAYVMRGLGDLHNSKVVDQMATAITDFMEGEFLLLEDWRNLNYLQSEASRDINRWRRRTYSTIGSLQGNSCRASMVLAEANQELQHQAFQFGRNLGFAWQAHTELQPFLDKEYQQVELPEMPPFPAFDLNCLPVILYMRSVNNGNNMKILNDLKQLADSRNSTLDHYSNSNANTTGRSTTLKNNEKEDENQISYNQHRHQEIINYEKLHKIIVSDGRAIEETYRIIENYTNDAIANLAAFPSCLSKDILYDICRSLCFRR